MSFDKRKDFQLEAEQAEKEFMEIYGKKDEEQAEPVAEASSNPETESTPEPSAAAETPEPETPPQPTVVDEEKYKAAVKAMNEAQRKAAESVKRKEEEFNKRQAEMEAKLNEALEKARLAMQRVPDPDPEDDSLEEDMPDVARLAERKAKRLLTPLEQRLVEMEKRLKEEETKRHQVESETKASKMLSEIKAAHSDYDEVVNSEEMTAWINNEAPPIYKAIFDGTIPFQAKDAIAVLNAYKSTTPKANKTTSGVSAAEIAAPVKTNPSINPKSNQPKMPTAKEMDWFMHNSHKLSPADLAEWDKRLNG